MIDEHRLADDGCPHHPEPADDRAIKPGTIFELRLRRFFMSDEAEITPAVTALFTVAGSIPNWKGIIERMAREAEDEIKGIPLANVRPMTLEEVRRHSDEDTD